MKIIKLPYLPVLDKLDLPLASSRMELEAQREYIDVVNWKEFPYKPLAVFDAARTDENLYIRFLVRGLSLKAVYDEDGSPVYQDSCVEFFMKQEDDDAYYNFEFNCIGVCDASRRISRTEKTGLENCEYESICRYPSLKAKAFGEIKGVHSWELLVIIPFKLMGLDTNNLPSKILGNFYHCADGTENPRYLSWNPINTPSPDFHQPKYFGEIIL